MQQHQYIDEGFVFAMVARVSSYVSLIGILNLHLPVIHTEEVFLYRVNEHVPILLCLIPVMAYITMMVSLVLYFILADRKRYRRDMFIYSILALIILFFVGDAFDGLFSSLAMSSFHLG